MNFKKKLTLASQRINPAILGAILGAVFFLAISIPSNKALYGMNSWTQQCISNQWKPTITSTEFAAKVSDECTSKFSGFIFALLQSSWFGPSIFIALVFPSTWTFTQSHYLPVSTIFFALIGAYSMGHYPGNKGVYRFLLSYLAVIIFITLYTFVLGLIVNG